MQLVARAVRALVAIAYGGGAMLPWLGQRIAAGGASLPASPTVNAGSVLALTACFRACTLLSDAISTSPPSIYAKQPNGGRELVADSAAGRALATLSQPDSELWAFSTALLGNGYLQIVRDGSGAPYELRALAPWRVQLEVESGTRKLWYRVAEDRSMEEPALLLPERDVIHAKYRCSGNRLMGTPPIASCAPAFALALQSREVQKTLFLNCCAPRGVLQAPGKIDRDVAKRLQSEWEQNYSGGGIGKTAVLSNGLEYQDMGFKAVDAELLDSIKASNADIARAYGIPRQFLEDVEHNTFASAVESTRALYALTLRAFASRMADAIAQRLLLRNERAAGASVEYDMTALLLLPGQDQADYLSKLCNAGLATPNELRNQYLSLPDLPGGDVLRAPTNTTPLDKWASGETPATTPVAPAGAEQ